MGIPAEEVPHFVRDYGGCHADTQRWLAAMGWLLIEVPVGPVYVSSWYGDNLTYPTIVSGPTVRSRDKKRTHVVVMLGNEMVYDPHPSGAGLLADCRHYVLAPRPDRYAPGMQEELERIAETIRDKEDKQPQYRDLVAAIEKTKKSVDAS